MRLLAMALCAIFMSHLRFVIEFLNASLAYFLIRNFALSDFWIPIKVTKILFDHFVLTCIERTTVTMVYRCKNRNLKSVNASRFITLLLRQDIQGIPYWLCVPTIAITELNANRERNNRVRLTLPIYKCSIFLAFNYESGGRQSISMLREERFIKTHFISIDMKTISYQIKYTSSFIQNSFVWPTLAIIISKTIIF